MVSYNIQEICYSDILLLHVVTPLYVVTLTHVVTPHTCSPLYMWSPPHTWSMPQGGSAEGVCGPSGEGGRAGVRLRLPTTDMGRTSRPLPSFHGTTRLLPDSHYLR